MVLDLLLCLLLKTCFCCLFLCVCLYANSFSRNWNYAADVQVSVSIKSKFEVYFLQKLIDSNLKKVETQSKRSVYGKDFPNFETLDAKIVAALNKITQNSQFKKQVSLEDQKAQKEDGFLRGRQIAFMMYEYFRVTGAHDAVLDYADSFSVTLNDVNIQEFDTRWDEVLLSMTKIPSDDILESLYKLRIRESYQLKNVLELYDMEIHQKTSVLNHQKLKTVVKR